MTILYALWLLLPFSFFCLAFWAVVKPYLGVRGKEDTKMYVSQAIFCSVALAIAIFVDRSSWFEPFIEMASFGMLDIKIATWLLYPGVLLALAMAQKIIFKEHPKRIMPSRTHY